MAVGLMAHGADGPTAAIADAARATAPPKPFGDVLKNSPGEWVLVADQSDEFDGKAIDTRKWDIDPKDWGAWSWSPENVRQQGGSLHLQMVQRTHKRGGRELYYVSGIARNRKPITYGYFEARIKGCSRYPGASPAFWMHSRGADNRYETIDGETVHYCEIDVVELQQSEFDFRTRRHFFRTRRHFPVNRIDCNLHALLVRDGKEYWLRPHTHPDICKTSFDAPWDPREDYHVYAVHNTKEQIVWYIDGKEVGRKPNRYWHLPMYVTVSLGLRYPFLTYENGVKTPVGENTTSEGFPTTMSVDYVRVWQRRGDPKVATDWTKAEYIAREKAKWARNGWKWNQAKVEANFAEIDSNGDGIASGRERQEWFRRRSAERARPGN